MTQVSRQPLSQAIYTRVFKVFLRSMVKVRNEKEAEEFINDLLTPTERIMLAKRLSIAILLTKGYDYETIRKILRVSPGTIASASVLLKYTGKEYGGVIKRLLREEEIKESLLNLADDFAAAGSLAGSPLWKDVRRAIRKKKKRQKPF